MSRSLVITDCDEVLLHMIGPYREWLAEQHGIAFHLVCNDFAKAMRYVETDELVPPQEIWRLLCAFFDSQMHRQAPIAGSLQAMARLAEQADVVVLTNLEHHRREARTRQLAELGLHVRVFTNQGPKGPAIRAILDEYQPTRAVFIDDIAQHHASAAEVVPEVRRLHFCGEPRIAPHIACAHAAGHAHARIDRWDEALPWLQGRLDD